MEPTPAATPDPHDAAGDPGVPDAVVVSGCGETGVPFGLPVLAEVPELAAVLAELVEADRLIASAIDRLIGMLGDGDGALDVTGVGIDGWLTIVANRTRTDRRMLLATVRTLSRLPSVRSAFVAGEISWSQIRSIVCKIIDRRLPASLDHQLDDALARAIDDFRGVDPDGLPRTVDHLLAVLDPGEPETVEVTPHRDRLLVQPRLDGTGGTAFADLGPVSFAALVTATEPGPPQTGPVRPHGPGSQPDHVVAGQVRLAQAERRAANLVALCRAGCGDGGRPTLLIRAELSTLLGHDRLPAQLLTHLAGGAMTVDPATAKALVDGGCDLRLTVTDRNAIVGVGRRQRAAPGWLTDAMLTLHDTCSEPGCLTAARICDQDHAQGWDDGGTTDTGNLAPVCVPGNRRRGRAGWHITQTPDGTRTWRHRRSGLTIRTRPTTWRPPSTSARNGTRPAARTPTERHLHRILTRTGPRAPDESHDGPPPGVPF